MSPAPRDYEHLIRLALLFAAGTVVFLAVRAFLVPPGFGELGHFRTGALADDASLPLRFAGRAACAECHDEPVTALAAGSHAAIGCESCHGALAAHAADPDQAKPVTIQVVELCALCHAANPARPSKHPQVEIEPHRDGSACTECHDAHSPAV